MVGYVQMSRAACYTVASYISGKTARCFHRSAHFTVAMVLYGAVIGIWLLWEVDEEQQWMFFFVACLEGIGSGVWRVQVGGKSLETEQKSIIC